MTRAELAERVAAESRYWHGKSHMTAANHAQYSALMKIYYRYVPPAAQLGAVDDLIAALVSGGPFDDRFWASRPCDDEPPPPGVPEGQ